MNKLTQARWAYLAGFLDGDGCITITTKNQRRTYCIEVRYSQTNGPFLQHLRDLVGIGSVYQTSKPKGNHSARFQWVFASGKAEEFLRAIFPFLVLKKDQAEIALKLAELMRQQRAKSYRLTEEAIEKREKIRQELRQLKGPKGKGLNYLGGKQPP